MSSAGDNERIVHDEPGLDHYHFPILPTGFREKEALAVSEKGGFKSSFEGNIEVSEFCTLFDNAKGKKAVSQSEDETEAIEKRVAQERKAAYAKGFDEGRKAGENDFEQRLADALESLQNAILKVDAVKTELYRDAERHAVKLGLMIARKIVLREISIDSNMVFRVVSEALKKIGDHKEVHVKMHPADLQTLNEAGINVEDLTAVSRDVYFEAGDDLRRGEVMVETALGDIDARIESQLQTVEESLRQVYQDGPVAT